ncbi:MAG: hypothetical protein A2341_19695 [Deltaproteobacteria bacterium RIFOXYB12_FULL_58_9]|nr:MAG: hypothetical protein A2341_19695 [Deltaproteobacteria bacterium RIFOXYB12_FULL_58_9]
MFSIRWSRVGLLCLSVACDSPEASIVLTAVSTTHTAAANACDGVNVCPQNTSRVVLTTVEAVLQGAFVYTKESCQATCMPQQRCILPFVPAVTNDVFTCTALEGFGQFPSVDDTDLSFAERYPPACFPRWQIRDDATAATRIEAVRALDIDGDDVGELLSTWESTDPDAWHVDVWRKGTEGYAVDSSANVPALFVGVTDFDLDSRDDMLAVTYDPDAETLALGIFYGRADGTQEMQIIETIDSCGGDTDDNPPPLHLADFNGDGYVDILQARDDCADAGTEGIYVWPSLDGRSFGTAVLAPQPDRSYDPWFIGDVDGDGSADFMLMSQTVMGALDIYFAEDDFAFPTTAVQSTGAQANNDLKGAHDFDGDGYADLWASAWDYTDQVWTFTIYRGHGDGGFTDVGSITPGGLAGPDEFNDNPCKMVAAGKLWGELGSQVAVACTHVDSGDVFGFLGIGAAGATEIRSLRKPKLRYGAGVSPFDFDADGTDELVGVSDAEDARILIIGGQQ